MKTSTTLPVAWLLMTLAIVPLSGMIAPVVASDHEIAVIVNEENATQEMSAREVRKLFLGKSRKLPDGTRALLVSLESLQSTFNKDALGKNNAQVKSAWARLQFTGRATPPREFKSAADVVEFVANNADAIGYVPLGALAEGVRGVFLLD